MALQILFLRVKHEPRKMKDQKLLSEHQKRRLGEGISALSNPIFEIPTKLSTLN